MENNILSEAQCGFVPGRSNVSQLLQVLEDWMVSLDEGNPIDIHYLDFKRPLARLSMTDLLSHPDHWAVAQNLPIWVRTDTQRPIIFHSYMPCLEQIFYSKRQCEKWFHDLSLWNKIILSNGTQF